MHLNLYLLSIFILVWILEKYIQQIQTKSIKITPDSYSRTYIDIYSYAIVSFSALNKKILFWFRDKKLNKSGIEIGIIPKTKIYPNLGITSFRVKKSKRRKFSPFVKKKFALLNLIIELAFNCMHVHPQKYNYKSKNIYCFLPKCAQFWQFSTLEMVWL